MKGARRVTVIGAGPAGVAATYDLAKRRIPVTCFEAACRVGGISGTVAHKGFRFDVGGHRFFSKIPAVNSLWKEILGKEFLLRPRLSRIYYNGRFFHYPLQPGNVLQGLGLARTAKILASYLKGRLFPLREEKNFEQWVTNRFGAELHTIFFKPYTEKVWGMPCTEIGAEWAAQRIRGLSLWTAAVNALFKQPTTVKSLIDEFHYPRLGPGQMYETMAEKAELLGAKLRLGYRVVAVEHQDCRISAVQLLHDGRQTREVGTDFISTMPITELVLAMRPHAPLQVLAAARALRYRSLVTVNLMLRRPEKFSDTWVYVHDPKFRTGRVQFFANWSPAMVPDANHSSLGLEYFCSEGDDLWSRPKDELRQLAVEEAVALGLVDRDEVFDALVIKMPKCYPVYDENHQRHVTTLRNYLANFHNLQLSGRYGLFKYNNMDHSIFTALCAVENLLGARHDLWSVNADEQYCEEEKVAKRQAGKLRFSEGFAG